MKTIIATLLLLACLFFSCKKNTNHNTEPISIEQDINQVSKDSISDSNEDTEEINGFSKEAFDDMVAEDTVLENGTYTNREDLKDIISKLGFAVFSRLEHNEDDPYLQLIELNEDKTAYMRACIHEDYDRMEFEIGSGKENQLSMYDIPLPVISISNMDTNYYYMEKIFVFKEGEEIEMHLKYTSVGEISDEYDAVMMVYRYEDITTVEFNNKVYATNTDAETLDIIICDEPERG